MAMRAQCRVKASKSFRSHGKMMPDPASIILDFTSAVAAMISSKSFRDESFEARAHCRPQTKFRFASVPNFPIHMST